MATITPLTERIDHYNPDTEYPGEGFGQCDNCENQFPEKQLRLVEQKTGHNKFYCPECVQFFKDDEQYEKLMPVYTKKDFNINAIYL